MKIDFKVLWTSLICILALIYFFIKKNHKILLLIIIFAGIIQIIYYIMEKCMRHLECHIDIQIEKKEPEYKSSNDELIGLISEYKKKNKSGGKK